MAAQLIFNREKLTRIFFFVAFIFVFYQLFLIAKSFLTAILLAAMLAMAFFPLNMKVRRVIKNPSLCSLLLTLVVFLAAVIPLLGVLWIVFREADRLLPTVRNFVSTTQHMDAVAFQDKVPAFLKSFVEPAVHFFQTWEVDPSAWVLKYVGAIGARITSLGALLARNAFLAAVNGIVLLVALFFAFRDGEKLLQWVLSLIPMEGSHKKALAKRAYETFMAVVMGVFITSSAQGLTAMIGFWIAGVNLPVLLGIGTGLAALLGASFIITLPVAFSVFRESSGMGIFLFIWGAVVVGLLDNVLKPILIGSRARMPFVLIFFSIIGGLKAYGLLGIILGPVIMASFLTFVSIYRKIFEMQAPTYSDEEP